jgi:hypothetical protein
MSSPGESGRSRPRLRLLAPLGWLTVAALLAYAIVGPTTAGAHEDAPGNNGTVKIHEGGTETEPIVRNEPHVCTFHLHFFFADAAQTGDWWIESWPPTGDGTVVLSGTYTTDANGEYRTPPAPGTYSLPDGHYKLFWQGRNEQNVKHKVFWVECPAPTPAGGGGGVAPTPTPTPTGTPVGGGVGPTATPTQPAGGGVAPGTGGLPGQGGAPGGEVAGVTTAPVVTPPATSTEDGTATQAADGRPLFVGLAGVLAVVIMLTPRRRPQRS